MPWVSPAIIEVTNWSCPEEAKLWKVCEKLVRPIV
jgi:hypothetical protein